MTAPSRPGLPEVVRVAVQEWDGDFTGKQHSHEAFEVRGGGITPDWAAKLNPPEAPWCIVTVYRPSEGGQWLASWRGSVWPAAWPMLFNSSQARGLPGPRLTALAEQLFAAARAIAELTDDQVRAERRRLEAEYHAVSAPDLGCYFSAQLVWRAVQVCDAALSPDGGVVGSGPWPPRMTQAEARAEVVQWIAERRTGGIP